MGRISRICCGPYNSISYLLISEKGNAVLIDSGPAAEDVLDALSAEEASLELVLLTHLHFDHVAGLPGLEDLLGVRALAHRRDVEIFQELWPSDYGPAPEVHPLDGEVRVDELVIEPIHTPGHTPGSVCYHVSDMGVVFTGDTLFKGNIGRVDLRHGDPGAMKDSLVRLMDLDPSTFVLPGHGEPTTIGAERANLDEYLRWLSEG